MSLQKLSDFTRRVIPQHIWHLFLAASSAGLILWSTIELFNHQCSSTLDNPNFVQPCAQLPWDLIPILIGFVFGVVGILGWHYKRSILVSMFFFISCDMLVTGLMSGLETDPGNRLFYIFLGLLAPLIYYFHIRWLKIETSKIVSTLSLIFTGICLISISPFVFFNSHFLALTGIAQPIKNIIRSLILLSTAATVLMIFIRYKKDTSFASRSRARLVIAGVIFAIAPMVFLNILPKLVSRYFIPAEFNLPWLLIIPITYGYSIFRSRLVKSESMVYRAMLYFLLTILVLFISLVVLGAINQLTGWSHAWLFFGLLIIVLGSWAYLPVRQGISRLVTWILYGEPPQYVRVIEDLNQAITRVVDRSTFGELIVTELMHAMPISGAALLLAEAGDCLSVQASTSLIVPGFLHTSLSGNPPQPLDFFIQESNPIDQSDLLKSSWFDTLSELDQIQISNSGIALWVPLVFDGRLSGLLLLGHKHYEDFFSLEDRRIISILAHQVGITAYNILLLEDIYAGQKELALANQQLHTARDKEQSRLARDLHDSVIQQLLVLSYRTLEMKKKLDHEGGDHEGSLAVQSDLTALHQDLLIIVSRIRTVIRDLRPTTLEELGLPETLESYLSQLEQEVASNEVQIKWNLEKTSEPMSYVVKINLFRITQEAVKNALTHAKAQRINVNLRFYDEVGALEVIDDGIGFKVPDRFSQFAQSNHFGLMGIHERATIIGGHLSVESRPMQGTRIAIRFQI